MTADNFGDFLFEKLFISFYFTRLQSMDIHSIGFNWFFICQTLVVKHGRSYGWSNRPYHFFEVRNKNSNCTSKDFFSYIIQWENYLDGKISFSQIEEKSKACLDLNQDTFGADIETVLQVMKYSRLGGANRYFVSKEWINWRNWN